MRCAKFGKKWLLPSKDRDFGDRSGGGYMSDVMVTWLWRHTPLPCPLFLKENTAVSPDLDNLLTSSMSRTVKYVWNANILKNKVALNFSCSGFFSRFTTMRCAKFGKKWLLPSKERDFGDRSGERSESHVMVTWLWRHASVLRDTAILAATCHTIICSYVLIWRGVH